MSLKWSPSKQPTNWGDVALKLLAALAIAAEAYWLWSLEWDWSWILGVRR